MSVEEWENDIGPGWRPLVRELDTKLREIDPDYKILQVKEKFGGLRYYFSSSIKIKTPDFPPSTEEQLGTSEQHRVEEMDALIRAAEAKSFRTCENCGSSDTKTTASGGYWIKTLCDSCRSVTTVKVTGKFEEGEK